MNALDYILSNYQLPKYEKSPKERAVLKALVHTLQPEELEILQRKLKRSSSKWNVGTDLYNVAVKAEKNIMPQRNEPISSLLKQFTDKKSGKVTSARKKLRDRFDKQDFQMQRKILKTMLYASKQDRIWGYNQLRTNWDNFFFDDVRILWEHYHEKECGAVIIKYFPMEYVYDNLSALDTHDNYTNLCIKLIHHPKFQIDKDRLKEAPVFSGYSEVEYLFILAKSKSHVEKGFATNTLFRLMVTFINTHDCPPKYLGNRSYDFERQIEEGKVSTKYFDFVSGILWCMGELGLAEELIAFEEWDSMVQRKLINSSDYDELTAFITTSSSEEFYILFRNMIAECLPNKYKHLIHFPYSSIDVVDNKPKKRVDELRVNSALSNFIDQLELEIVE